MSPPHRDGDRTPRLRRRAFLASVGSVAVAGCADAEAINDHTVTMHSTRFDPSTIRVAPQETVTWENKVNRQHTVTAYERGVAAQPGNYFASGGFDSREAAVEAFREREAGVVRTGGTYEHTFTVPGVYWYSCLVHGGMGMAGKVLVGSQDNVPEPGR